MRLYIPFLSSQSEKQPVPEKVIERATEQLSLVGLNGIATGIEDALKKHLDPNHPDYLADYQGGHFNTEFNLIATNARMKGVYAREPWVYTSATIIAKTLATVSYQVVRNDTDEVDAEHPMNKVISAGNSLQDSFSLDWSGNLDLVLSGDYFLILQGKNLVHIPVEYVELVLNTDGKSRLKDPILGINVTQNGVYSGVSIEKSFVEWKDVIHFKLPNPYNPFVGFSMISAASRPILLDRHKNEFEMAFYLRGGTNSGVIETTADISKDRMARLMRTYEQTYTGRRNWFRQIFLPKGAVWKNSGLTMTEMQHLEGLRENRLTLLAVMGVPPSKVGIVHDVNRATSEEQDRTFYENTIIPLAKMKAAGWNNSYLVKKVYRDEIRIEPNFDDVDAVEGGVLTRAEQATSLNDIATLNEQRKIAKLPPLKQTDPRGKLFYSELKARATNPLISADFATVNVDEFGPEDEPVGKLSKIEVDSGGAGHTHVAEIDEIGNGMTIWTSEETEDHQHEIIEGEFQPGGEDGHVHPSVNVKDRIEDEKSFQRVKAIATGVQEGIEESQGRKYSKAFERYLKIKIEQAKEALNLGFDDIRSWLAEGTQTRQSQYFKDAIPILQESMIRGFAFAQTQTRSFKQASVKVFEFTAQDELAIEVLKRRTEGGKRLTLSQRNIQQFVGFDNTSTEMIQKLVEKGEEEGKTLEQIAKTIEKDFGEAYRDQAFTIARTETLYAVSQGLQWQNEVLNQVFTEVNKQWFHIGDTSSNPEARKGHASFESSGVKGVVSSDHVWTNPITGAQLRYPRDPAGGAGDVINCFVEDTKVTSHSVSNVFRRLYRGELVTVKLENGKQFTGTPNHPMLTTCGWVALGKLNKSHELIKANIANSGKITTDLNIGRMPTKFGEIFTALSNSSGVQRFNGRSVDFHGDGTTADVEVVLKDSLLRNPVYADGSQPFNDFSFPHSNFAQSRLLSNSRLDKSISRITFTHSDICTSDLQSPSFGGHARPFDGFGLRSVAPFESESFKRSSNSDSTYSKSFRKFVDTNGFVDVESVKISSIVISENSSGHVYNLSTVNEMYTVEGIVTHNCRCSMVSVIPKTAQSNANQILDRG